MAEANPLKQTPKAAPNTKSDKIHNILSQANQLPQRKFSYEVKITNAKCKSCQLCIFYCPAQHLELSTDLNIKGLRYTKIKAATKCTGCGFCFLVCPDACIEVYERKNI